MRNFALVVAVALGLGGCGKEIGDACVTAADCDPNGERSCDISQKEGYCTIQGCDFSTCPDEAACIRFFTGGFSNKTCENSPDECSLDELCDLNKRCVARSSEVRFCMRTCSDDSDCRDGYECRDIAKMKAHGGEPVLAPGSTVDDSSPKFCASAPSTL
ncbi:MAG: hypothetical protein HOV81_31685 [Kofleriaceae bacterium]|nr:hypothetical protein [Kofleriaceae bacterium]